MNIITNKIRKGFVSFQAFNFLEDITDSAVALTQAQKNLVLNTIRSNVFWIAENERDLIASLIEK